MINQEIFPIDDASPVMKFSTCPALSIHFYSSAIHTPLFFLIASRNRLQIPLLTSSDSRKRHLDKFTFSNCCKQFSISGIFQGLSSRQPMATLIGQRDTRSVKSKFVPLLRYFHSAYVQYASIKCLAGTKIYLFSTL